MTAAQCVVLVQEQNDTLGGSARARGLGPPNIALMSGTRAPSPTDEAGDNRDEKIEVAKEKLEEIEADPTTPPKPKDPAARIERDQAWWHRHLEPEERKRILAELGIKKEPNWGFRFFTMFGLSVVVAVMGLSADSAAVVIGAMLIAPLMQPVLAAAACISMALFKKSLQSIGIVVVATFGAILLSYLLAAMFVTGELPDQVLSRTAPDIRDLIVALGAGTAGAYATVRKDVSASLPGVAVAVALVPPLGAVGIALEAGRETLAGGAMLLYTTNLAAIVFAASIVFVVTGFVPPKRLRNTFRRTSLVAAVVAITVAAIAVPLYRASQTAVQRTDQQLAAGPIVSSWLETNDVQATETPIVSFGDDRILVQVRSFDLPPDQGALIDTLQSQFGEENQISIEWDRLTQATTTTTIAPTTTVPSEAELLYTEVERIVNNWLQDDEFEGARRIEALVIGGGVVRVDASGVGDAPSVTGLISDLDAELDEPLTVQLTWVERRNVPAQEQEQTPTEIIANQISAVTQEWAGINSVEVLDVSYDGSTALIDVAGARQPDASDLVREVEALIPETATVTVLFTERLDITTTTTTTTDPPTTTTP